MNVRTLVIGLVTGQALLVAAAGCGKKVPAEIRPTLDAIRPDARTVADAAAKVCAAQFASGRFKATPTGCSVNVLPGEKVVPDIPSPAKGMSLESNPGVLDVQVMCDAPVNATESCGSSLGSLHNAIRGSGANRMRHVVEGSCKSVPASPCEEVVVPSESAMDETSADLRLIRPLTGGPSGATAEVTVILAKR